MNYKAITISQAEQSQTSSVWAMNTSGTQGSAKGIINITITEGNGRASVVRIPVTFIPIDLTTQATKSAILMSPDFRRLVAGRMVTLLSEEDALKMLDNEKAQEEMRRLLNVEHAHEVQDSQMPTEAQSVMAQADGAISGLALNIAHSEGDEEAMMANLRNNRESLTQEELKYIVNNSMSPKVKAMAAEYIVK
jgi:hypothetical protein